MQVEDSCYQIGVKFSNRCLNVYVMHAFDICVKLNPDGSISDGEEPDCTAKRDTKMPNKQC